MNKICLNTAEKLLQTLATLTTVKQCFKRVTVIRQQVQNSACYENIALEFYIFKWNTY